MNQHLVNIGLPTYLTLSMEDEIFETKVTTPTITFHDIHINLGHTGTPYIISLSANQTPVKWLKLRWQTQWP